MTPEQRRFQARRRRLARHNGRIVHRKPVYVASSEVVQGKPAASLLPEVPVNG
jgi:hypothetical protein